MQHTNYIVVGGGIAGTTLCLELSKSGKRIIWIDNSALSSSTRVAAGIMNPLVFRYLTEVWRAGEIFPFALDYYTQFDVKSKSACLNKVPLVKIFGEHDPVLWKRKNQDIKIGRWIVETEKTIENRKIVNPFKAGLVEAAWLDTATFLELAMQSLKENVLVRQETFDHAQLQVQTSGIIYRDIAADHIIFCEGHLATQNPYFNFIPFRPVKGELLDVIIEDFECKQLINKDIFVLPLGNQLYRVGSTYDWNDLTETPTKEGKHYLISKLQQFIDAPVHVVKHQAGIRPAVADRRPVAGFHPDNPKLAILNGLGARGVMLAPYFSRYLVNLLEYGGALDNEVDPRRFIRNVSG